ncbi:HD-GYP domain-containing protein [Thiocystis violascens]|uniref:Putative domain HDIG-containing protein n=1 Tax=Thiocystis violascens (strain ATCC 17096 / DSM 198 / 6111) TaxID=765911 RepID=I3Y8M6_THIV6|nr:HD-GYP domain-containing protein [Thiocystis violascens]AFL73344.1 putative domain HDIG-containing protein [Thiocystis violascens DSM 198]
MTIPDRVELHAVIDVVLTTLDARDPYTYEHSFRVALYSEMMARELRLSPVLRQRIEVAAYLHDIGKIAIADQVLNKAGRLNRDEMIEIQRHPRIGFNILSRLPTFHEVATIVLHHHERVDGDGYPERLAGDAIPLESRIIGIADAFDAMTSSRPYRKALAADAALAELNRHAGEQFDSEIVAIFSRLRDPLCEHLSNGLDPVNGGHHAYVGHEDLMHSRIVQNAGFFVEDERPVRRAIPSTLFGRDWTQNLYSRYHALQHNASRKGVPFHWSSFADFLTALAVVAPGDYHPRTYRFDFDLKRIDARGRRLGYCQDTMRFKPATTKSSRTSVHNKTARALPERGESKTRVKPLSQ